MSTFDGPPDYKDPFAKTRDSREMLRQAHSAAGDIRAVFEASRKGKRGGNSTNAEQDLLRAMLVFAAAGMDATIKQLVRDALPKLVADGQPGTIRALEAFAVRKLQIRSGDPTLDGRNAVNLTGWRN